jgi:hypothetical protein
MGHPPKRLWSVIGDMNRAVIPRAARNDSLGAGAISKASAESYWNGVKWPIFSRLVRRYFSVLS